MSNDTTDFQRLKQMRKLLKYSQVEMAEIAGISQAQYSSIERGQSSLTYSHLEALYKKLKVNPIWILSGNGNMMVSEDAYNAYKKSPPNDPSNDPPNGPSNLEQKPILNIGKGDMAKLGGTEPAKKPKGFLKFLYDLDDVDPHKIDVTMMFKVPNNKMADLFHKGEKVIGYKTNINDLGTNELCVLYKSDEQFWIGRVTWNATGVFVVTYENSDAAPDLVPGEEVNDIYKLLFLFKEP